MPKPIKTREVVRDVKTRVPHVGVQMKRAAQKSKDATAKQWSSRMNIMLRVLSRKRRRVQRRMRHKGQMHKGKRLQSKSMQRPRKRPNSVEKLSWTSLFLRLKTAR